VAEHEIANLRERLNEKTEKSRSLGALFFFAFLFNSFKMTKFPIFPKQFEAWKTLKQTKNAIYFPVKKNANVYNHKFLIFNLNSKKHTKMQNSFKIQSKHNNKNPTTENPGFCFFCVCFFSLSSDFTTERKKCSILNSNFNSLPLPLTE
jgi:hypothetical protein